MSNFAEGDTLFYYIPGTTLVAPCTVTALGKDGTLTLQPGVALPAGPEFGPVNSADCVKRSFHLKPGHTFALYSMSKPFDVNNPVDSKFAGGTPAGMADKN